MQVVSRPSKMGGLYLSLSQLTLSRVSMAKSQIEHRSPLNYSDAHTVMYGVISIRFGTLILNMLSLMVNMLLSLMVKKDLLSDILHVENVLAISLWSSDMCALCTETSYPTENVL